MRVRRGCSASGWRGLLATGQVLLLLVLLLVAWGAPVAAGVAPRGADEPPDTPEEAFVFPSTRGPSLPSTVTPSEYIVTLRPDFQDPLENTTDFSGEVVFNFVVSSSTTQVLLHAGDGIEVQNVEIKRNDTIYDVSAHGKESDIYRITTSSQLASGQSNIYTATISFNGKFQEGTNGFYKSKYVKDNEETGILFTTQFQPGHARKAFPCLDEPNFKATFQLTIDVPEGYNALSNTPVEESRYISKDGESVKEITFKKTPKMSSYLVAFVLYEIDSFLPSHTVITHNEVTIITWAPKYAIEGRLTDYSQDITFKILRELEDYTEIQYTEHMQKLDQVAVADFSAGAMENWGLVTYRESRLFFNESSDTEAYRKSVAMVIGHELTHQWFGNLVTTKWWDTTWLNEGFARYFQYLILSRILPSWRMMDQLLLDQQMAIFVTDSAASALPLTNDVTTAAEVSASFGTITYSKGASIVRMLGYLMGEEYFQKGLQSYLAKGTVAVEPSDLFTSLEQYLPDDRKPSTSLENAMAAWTTKSGFPVVHIERNYRTLTAEISQYRFFLDGTEEDAESATIYNIPVTWSSRDNERERFFWFSTNTTLTRLPEMENWMLVHAYGYYRVNYDEANWMTLAWTMAGKEQQRIAPADRAKLVEDAFALARIGRLPYRILGYLLRYLVNEQDVLPWAAAERGLTYLDMPLGNVDEEGVFYGFLRQATAAVFTALSGFSRRGDSPELIMRSNLLRWACRSGHAQCLQQAANLLALHLYDGAQLDVNLKDVILCYGSRAGGDKLWEELWLAYKNAEGAERAPLLTALGCIDDSDKLHIFFRRVAQGEYGAYPSETRSAFQAAISHPKGVAAALEFLFVNVLNLRRWTDSETVENIMSDLANQLTSETQAQRFSRFLEEQLEEDLLEDSFVDDLQAKVKTSAAAVAAYSEEALKAFSDSTPREAEADSAAPAPTEGSGRATPTAAPLLFLALLGTVWALGEHFY